MLERFLDQLCADLEFNAVPSRDETGKFPLRLNDSLTIFIEPLDPGFYFSARLSTCPSRKLEELFTHLMQANFLGQGTGGACIGLSEDEKFLTLSHHLSYDMNYTDFKQRLEDFANFVDYWKTEINVYAVE